MNRKICYWKLRSVELQLADKTLIMGVLNVTPDSFSDGGKYSDADRAYARALELEEQGADIIDIGAESTRPGSKRISAEEEWRRLVPILKRLRDKLTVPLSLDTYKAEIAERAFEYGIEIVNDPSGLTFDADLAKTVANANAGLILNHMRGTPETWARLPPLPDMIGSVARDLEATVNRARRAGVERNRIAIDPGLGFGKRREQDCELLAHLRQLAALEYPILTGPSRKSFLAQESEQETLCATAAAVAISIMNGAHLVRVHDVKEMRAVAQIVDEVVRAADAKQEALLAQQAAERVAPRRTAREMDDRPRSVIPPVARRVPRIEVASEPERMEVAPAVIAEVPVAEVVVAEVPVVEVPVVEVPVVEVPVVEVPVVEVPVVEGPTPKELMDASDEVVAAPSVAPIGEERPERPHEEKRKVPRQAAKSEEFKKARPAAKPYGDRPQRRDSGERPPRREFSDRPPRRDFGSSKPPGGDRPPRRDFGSSRPPSGDRPPRRDFGSSKPPSGDRPPRRDFGSSRPPSGDRPPRRDFGSGKPPSGDRPPRRDFGSGKPPSGDRPPRRDFGSGKPPSGDRPPRRDFGGGKPASGDRPPRRDFGSSRPPSEDRPPRRDFGDRPPRRESGPPRGKGPAGGSKRPPSRPFRKRP